MVEIVVSVAAKVSEYLVDPAVRQLGYLFNYRANIEHLSLQVEKLRDARARLQHSVDEAIGNGHIIEDDACKWMKRADEFIQNACKFLEDEKEARKSCFNGLCPNLKSRYQLSREARKKAGVSVQILGDRQFEKVSYRAPLQEIRSAPSEALQSRMLTLNEVMEALRDANINRIGVWGLGGVGKSTLVKQVAEQAEQEKLFRKVVMVPVFQTPDFKGIQQQIADKLGMKFEEVSEQGRADRLHQRIKQENTILIILDDLWAELELEKVGIPSPDDHKGCKLVLTSRNKQVLSNEMSTQKDFRVQHLQEDETWILFKNTAGDSIKNPELQPIAVDVAKECAGLPIAIVTVAKALKNKNVSIWKDALQQLKSQTSTNITGMETKVYSSLKLSYEHLEGDEVKSLCLLCGLFSSDIHIGDLLKYGVGLRLFQGTNTLEEAKNRIDTLVDNLKSSNFLLETDHNAYVRMHDLVRSTARKIASEQRHVFTHQKTTVRVEEWSRIDELQVTWVKLHDCDIHELPEGLVCPKLEFFECFLKTHSAVKIPNTFFEGMKQLKVLDFSRMQLPSLPLSIQCLANLRTLCLDGCKLGDIVIIAELKKLEILSLMSSDMEQLPREIAQLTHLRLLDLSDSSTIKVIPSGVISSLFRLEDLCMENSFTQWEGEGKSNACLAELKHLSHLTFLDIQIPDAKLLPKDIVFENLVRYRILVGDVWSWEEIFEANSTLKLNKFDTSLHLVDGISKLLKRTEDLHLRELCGGTNVLSKLNREGFLKLKHLNVESSPEIQYIVNSMDLTSSHGAFPVMETLSLNQLINLQEVCHGQFPAGSLGCLRKVEVEDCDGLKFLFSLSVARGLSRLEETKVTRCKSMVEMVSQGRKEIKEDAVNVPLFPELRYLTLEDLPKLSNFCFEENPVLSKPASTIVGPSTPPLNQPEIRDGQLLLSLGGNLRSLKLKNCMSLLKLFPPSLLQNLEELIVENCGQLEHVFDLEELNVDDGHVELLPKLKELRLSGLPKLRHICNCGSSRNHFPSSMASAPVGNIIFPKLSDIKLESLPNLTSFVSPGYHSLQRLHHADLDTPFPVLFDERVAFPSLKFLIISGLDNVKKIWHNQIPQDSFSKLEVVKVASCGELLNIFPSCVLKRSQSLRLMEVVDCSLLEEVFDVEGTNVNVNVKEGVTVTQLSQLILRLLPKVEKIWNKDPHGILNFQNLKSIFIDKCQSLKNLFPASLVKDLVQLEKLELRSCGIEEIVAKDNEAETAAKFVFPKVTSLILVNLHQLRSFYPGAHTSQWPLLKELIVRACDKVNVFASETPTFQRRHHEGSFDMPSLQPLFLLQQVALPYLEELILNDNGNTEIWQEQFPMDSFPRLRYLKVYGYIDILVVIPSFMLQRSHNLEKLNVRRCSSVKEIFQLEGLDEENQAQRLGRLREIWLRDLPALTHLWKENSKSILDLQSLESLEVWNCDSLISLVPCSVSFQNLDTLDVWSCSNLRSLISPSVAKSLVKLRKLKIGGLHMMEEVVANEGGEAVDEIAFYKLQHMVLLCLPNLTSFNSGGYIFSFPSLEHMVVEECPKMKIFSPSLVTTPKLERVEVADDEWHWHNDLNTTIHNLFKKTHGVFPRNLALLHTWRW
ncbi:probable disease resistance protein At4g27220 isoform X2 [Vitis vinifera]|uniref:probable disease resistance protein At4g27220 isoform X2 n=1 Tax=Vitis vinifera TaxID=29760 RepID=UPI002882E395|nr:probable disease resistance protein At4g27220 isoform X2 [Vitis vinifera]